MLSVERNDIFDIAYRFITETQESIFLTGKAGTGKTTFLKFLRDNSVKNMIMAAPTGVAAINAGGVTLHSLFQLPLYPFLPSENNKMQLLQSLRYNQERISLLRKMELLVIDEISMVRCDVIDAIDAILQNVRRNHTESFGGVQMLFIGDLHQLPPVAKNEEWKILSEYYASPFFFDSKAVKEKAPLLIELNKIYRQKEESFVALLNKVRNNQMNKEDYELLNNRFVQGFRPSPGEKYITLTSHNNQADNINQIALQKLSTPAYTFRATIEMDFPENIYPAEASLVLKEGAQVMFIKNDAAEKKYFNGKIGIVLKLGRDAITINCDGQDIEVYKEVWDNTRYTLNPATKQLEQKLLGRFHQYPLRLAWAITIHKSQGLTFEKVMIDAAASFSGGQVYVALSRCTNLNGIVLLSKIPPAAIYNNDHVVNAQSVLSPKGSLAERFAGARQVFTIQLLSEIFLMEEINKTAFFLKSTINAHIEKLNPETAVWLNDFIEIIRKQKTIAGKFISCARGLIKEIPAIEDNQPLQKRINDAAGYFLPLLSGMKNNLENHPFIIEHKEAAAAVDESLTELMAALIKAIYNMQYCIHSFTVPGFLKHKLSLSVPRLQLSSYAAGKKQTVTADIPNPELYLSIKSWRDNICESKNLPVFCVAGNHSLKEICAYLPLTLQHLQVLSGFGKAKAEKYGNEIIDLIKNYCRLHGLETNMGLKEAGPKRKRKIPPENKTEKISSGNISLQYFNEGKAIEEIARLRNLAVTTIKGHLAEFIKTGELAVDMFADNSKVEIISELISKNPDRPHTELRSMLGDQFSFSEIRAVANHLIWLQNTGAGTLPVIS